MCIHDEMLPKSELQRYEEDGRTRVSDGTAKCQCGCNQIIPEGCTIVINDGGQSIAANCLPY